MQPSILVGMRLERLPVTRLIRADASNGFDWMVIHKTLFEIAIYRVDKESWSQSAQGRIDAGVRKALDEWSRFVIEADADARKRAERMVRFNERPVEWEYNEVMAWLRLVWDGPGPVV